MKHSEKVNYSTFIPNSSWLITAGASRIVRIWDVTSGKQIYQLEAGGSDHYRILNTGKLEANFLHENKVYYIALNSNGKLLATRTNGEINNIVYIWDVKNKKQIFELKHSERVNNITFIPNSSWLITSSADRIVRIWDVTSGKQIDQLEDSDHFQLSRDGSTLLVTSDKEVRVINMKSWIHGITTPLITTALRFASQNKVINIHQFHISQNGERVVRIDKDKFVTIWNAQTGELIKKTPLNIPLVRVLNRDGSLLLLIGFGTTAKEPQKLLREIRIIELETGEELLRTSILTRFRFLGFSQDGHHWLSRDPLDASLKQHPWRTKDLIANLCTRLPRNFTQEEWNQYMGNIPYQTSCDNLPVP